MTVRIVLLPGDGIGPEVIEAAATVLQSVARRGGFTLDFETHAIGGAALRAGYPPLPDATREACLAADAVLLGAVGDPEFDREPRERKPETALLGLRRAMGVYANLRPIAIWAPLAGQGPLKPERLAGVDMVIVRELTGGLYFAEPRGFADDRASAYNTMRYATYEIERIARMAFSLAVTRRGKVTSVDKANVLETSQLWRRVVADIGATYPGVTLEHMYVDNCAMQIILDPARFDVVLTENLFGDILSDEGGAIVGSLGLLPSASLGAGPGLYEPVHGSAPDLAGRDVANPIGTIASAALLLRYSLKLENEAAAVEEAIGRALADGYRTADLAPAGGRASTCSAMTRAIVERLD